MFKRLFISPFLLAALLFTLPATAATTLFEVSKDGDRFLLGGTVHMLRPDDFPLPPAFDTAYRQADALYLESDLAAVEDPAFFQKLMQAMLYPPGKTLQSELSPEVWQSLKKAAEKHDFPVHQFVGFDPVFVSMIMTIRIAEKKGVTAGVDKHFLQKARRDGKPVGQLESPEDMLGYMKALSGQDDDAIVRASLKELNRFEALMETTVSAWRRGDLEALDREMGQPLRDQAPGMYQTLLVDRNRAWLPRLEALSDNDELELVLVGALHLAGEDNLLAQLRERGYRVRPYTPETD